MKPFGQCIWGFSLCLFLAGCQTNDSQQDAYFSERIAFDPSGFNPANGMFRQGSLESLDSSDQSGTGNIDGATTFPTYGVIRLGNSGKTCRPPDEKPQLCDIRNEIRSGQGPFLKPVFYRISINLSKARGGVANLSPEGGGNRRLIIAQMKFRGDFSQSGFKNFSPVMALRYEDDQLYVTTEMMGELKPAEVVGIRCKGGYLAENVKETKEGPHRVLLTAEGGELPWDFDPASRPGRIFCIAGPNITGDAAFARQPRDRPFTVAMHMDGGRADTAVVAFYLGKNRVARAAGNLAPRIQAEQRDFKFGIYGDFPKNHAIAVDYSDFRTGPTKLSIGY